MATLKYSRQREAIKAYLCDTKIHPTADMVYEEIRKQYPNISLGTVYRNLSLLVELGEAIRITSGDGIDHFDGDTSTHYHFTCESCKQIYDIEDEFEAELKSINDKLKTNPVGRIRKSVISFYGQCSCCMGLVN